jgi:hypothetical protein
LPFGRDPLLVQTQQSNIAEPSFQSKVGAIIRKELLQILERLDVLLRNDGDEIIEIEEQISPQACPETNERKDPVILS